MSSKKLSAVSVVLAMIAASSAVAATQVYCLGPGSTYQEGCVEPCLCPIWMSDETEGTFVMMDAGSDPLFTYYRLESISWRAMFNGEVIREITGSGVYRIGGEVALMHQLTLDIRIDGGEPVHLDSGLIIGGSSFPSISISVSQGTPCYDIWMDIEAAPAWCCGASIDVKANGSDGPVDVAEGAPLSVTVSSVSNDRSCTSADWWLVANTPSGWYHYDLTSGTWRPGFTVTYQGAVSDIPPTEVFRSQDLTLGLYTVYFGWDAMMDGVLQLEGLYYDAVEVNITDE